MNNEDKQTLDVSGGTGMPLETLNWHRTALKQEPPSPIEFRKSGEWVIKITADRRIEVNEGTTVTEAAQAVLEALQTLMKQPEQEPVAWMHTTATGHVYFRKKPQDAVFNPQPLYAQPPSKPDPAADAMRDFFRNGVGVIAAD